MTPHRYPRVTVILPVLNRELLLDESLDSIAAQTSPPFEVIVVDGGSSDATAAVARGRSFVRLIESAGAGVPEAYNIAIARSSGELVAFASSDDLLQPDALARHREALIRSPFAGASCGRTEFFGEPGNRSVPAGLAGSVRSARVLEALVVRREVFHDHGCFREDLGPSADLEWVSRIADAGVVVVDVPELVVRKRLHRDNTSYGRRETAAEMLVALRAVLGRRRGEA